MSLRDRWLRGCLLLAVMLPMALACNDDVEDGCPAMEGVLEKAEAEGRLEPLPKSVSDEQYKIELVDRSVMENCLVVYRFHISGMDRESWGPGPRSMLKEDVCGPGGASSASHYWQGDQLVVEAGYDQWQRSGTYSIGVGTPDCGRLSLPFEHVGRLPVDREQ